MKETDDFAILKNYIERFVQPSAAEYAYFQSLVQVQSFPRNALLLQSGGVCDSVFFLTSGMVRYYFVKQDEAGKSIEGTVWFVSAGDLSTDVYSLLSRKEGFINIIACTDVRAAVMTYADMEQLYASSPTWERFGRLTTALYLMQVEERNGDFQFKSATERYQKILEKNPDLLRHVSLSHIASYLGISLETLSRIRAKPL
jgi:CRP/FNR family transcriptional regulator, anaerobic regulatory protein